MRLPKTGCLVSRCETNDPGLGERTWDAPLREEDACAKARGRVGVLPRRDRRDEGREKRGDECKTWVHERAPECESTIKLTTGTLQ